MRTACWVAVWGLTVLSSVTACTRKMDLPMPEGIGKLEEALKATPSFENHIALGLEYANHGRREQALDMYVKARGINPTSPLAWNNICAELNTQKRHGEALQACEKAAALDPNFELAKNNLHYTKKLLSSAKDVANEKKKVAVAKKSLPPVEAMQLGLEFYNLQDFASAIQIWKLIPVTDAEYSKAQNNIATSYILLGDLPKADVAIRTALKIEPTNTLYINNQRWLISEQGKATKPMARSAGVQ